MLKACQLFAAFVCLTIGSGAVAVDIRPMATAGLMQQPTSQYYHLVEGGSLEVELVKTWSIRATYLERPVFRSAGYLDQDLFAFIQTGSSFYRKGPLDMFGYFGAGRCWGYIKEETPAPGMESPRRNDYQMAAATLSMEAAYSVSIFDFRLGHSLLVGKGPTDIYTSKVAWPFTIFYLTATTHLFSGSKR